MNLSETARILGAMASFDRRTVGATDVAGWQAVLGDVDFADALEAVQRHYAENTEWMMPAHVRRIVASIELDRARAGRKWAPGQFGVPPEDALPEITGGPQLSDAAISAMPPELRELLDRLAEEKGLTPDRSKLFPRQAYWEQEHKAYLRSHGGEPNPLYRPIEERECVVTGDGECQTHNRHVSSCPASGRGPVRTTAEMSTGVLPDAHRCANCSFVTASVERMVGHLKATGHVHEWAD